MTLIASTKNGAKTNPRIEASRYFSEEELAAINHEITLYPTLQAVAIEAMKIVQQQRGWVSDDSIESIAAYLQMNPAELDSVATFYNLIYRQPVGKKVILLCDSVSCWMLGCNGIKEKITAQLGIDFGETSSDGEYTLLPITCLGDCDHAPAMMINEQHYHDLTADKVEKILSTKRGGGDG